MFLVLGSFVSVFLGITLTLLSLFLILLVLVQRGRGGGLTGALGGPGGQSAFGSRAGDLFTRITSVVALVWIGLCAFTIWLLGNGQEIGGGIRADSVIESPTGDTESEDELGGGLGGDASGDALGPGGLQFPQDGEGDTGPIQLPGAPEGAPAPGDALLPTDQPSGAPPAEQGLDVPLSPPEPADPTDTGAAPPESEGAAADAGEAPAETDAPAADRGEGAEDGPEDESAENGS